MYIASLLNSFHLSWFLSLTGVPGYGSVGHLTIKHQLWHYREYNNTIRNSFITITCRSTHLVSGLKYLCFKSSWVNSEHMCAYYNHFFFNPWEFLHIIVCWWFFTGDRVTSSLLKSQNSSQYSSRSQQCRSLDGLHSSSYFSLPLSFCQSFGVCTKNTNMCNWYNR